jgi:hypothetical protein
MEQVRDQTLDRYCESIGDTRDQMNRLRQDEAADTSGALRRMQGKGVNHYIHAGVELTRVPGSDKLRVRRTSADDAQELETREASDNVLGDEEQDQADNDALVNGEGQEAEG